MTVIIQFSLSVVTLCSLVVCHQRFGGTCCLYLEGDGVKHSAENNVGYRERVYNRTLVFPVLRFAPAFTLRLNIWL